MAIRRRVKVYHSRWHLLGAFALILIPFLFLLLFSKIANLASERLFSEVFISLGRLAVSYLIAVSLAWICAISFARGKISHFALPVFDVLQSFPIFAILPLATYFLGVGNFTVILFLVASIVWQIFFSIVSSMRLIKHDWEEAVVFSQIRGFSYLRYFLLPVSFPGVIIGSIIGLGEGWAAIVATEIIVGVKSGLGDFFQRTAHDPTVTAFGILGLLLIVFTLNKLLWTPLLDFSHQKMEE